MSGQEEIHRALVEEFPGWQIEVTQDDTGVGWDASRTLAPGHGGAIGLHSDNAALLRELLEEAEHCDHRLALRELAAKLTERGMPTRLYPTSLIITAPDERELLITCKHKMFCWAMSGREIGPTADISGAVKHVVDAVQVSPP
ncbi:hypothetical protein [Actinomadura macra]|uniref:hypothetical protein n=1 Tax=Actinomadura macra TaxID=46164 RepID=UPI0008323B17|nr:hypothetical protein [Actinomadura macra]